jgi:hypothetical protein
VRATGEKTAREPDWRRTGIDVSFVRSVEETLCTDCASSTNLDPAKSPKGNGQCCDNPGYNLADDHDLGRVGGYEFLRHVDILRTSSVRRAIVRIFERRKLYVNGRMRWRLGNFDGRRHKMTQCSRSRDRALMR